jgi:serine/threonine protein kinase
MVLENGKTLGHFTILAPIGQGGMGEVYRARDERLGRQVALKFLLVEQENPDAIARFHQPTVE